MSTTVPSPAAIEYPCSHRKPMPENDWHAAATTYLRAAVSIRYADCPKVYVAGNLFIYYKEWRAQWFREGHEQGVAQGVAQGAAQGKAELLRGQAARKFGGPEGERVSALIEHIRDPDQLATVGGWLIECESASDLLARLERLPSANDAERGNGQ